MYMISIDTTRSGLPTKETKEAEKWHSNCSKEVELEQVEMLTGFIKDLMELILMIEGFKYNGKF